MTVTTSLSISTPWNPQIITQEIIKFPSTAHNSHKGPY